MIPPRKIYKPIDFAAGVTIATLPEGFPCTPEFMLECDRAFMDAGHELTPAEVLNLARNLGYDT